MATGYPHHDATTAYRPQLSFTAQSPVTVPVARDTSKSGWLVSGLAATLALAALSVVSVYAFDAFTHDPEPVSVSTPEAPSADVAVAPPASAPPAVAPQRTLDPVSVPRVILVPSQVSAPADPGRPITPADEPVVIPSEPVTPPASDPISPPTPVEPGKPCGPACTPLPAPVEPGKPCGPACTPKPAQ